MNSNINPATVRALAIDAIRSGQGDWVGLWELVLDALDRLGSTDELATKAVVLRTIAYLIDEGLAEVGDLHTKGFHPWQLSTESVLERIETEWTNLERVPNIGDICWLNITPKGDRMFLALGEQHAP